MLKGQLVEYSFWQVGYYTARRLNYGAGMLEERFSIVTNRVFGKKFNHA